MMSSISSHTTSPCFQLKGSMVTLMILELYRYDEELLQQQLQELLADAPCFFNNTPVVVGFDHLHNPEALVDLARLITLCAGAGINLIAIRGGNSQQRKSASKAGLACLPTLHPPALRKEQSDDVSVRNKVSIRRTTRVTTLYSSELDLRDDLAESPTAPEEPKLINVPIRSGQQVYHNGDLILTGPVSAGAEVLAGGHIHAYGPFRGRALAGVSGNAKARIFCSRFEAELVSIFGHYKLAISADKHLWKQAVQVYMDQGSLILQRL